jgi:hypothetical protein
MSDVSEECSASAWVQEMCQRQMEVCRSGSLVGKG